MKDGAREASESAVHRERLYFGSQEEPFRAEEGTRIAFCRPRLKGGQAKPAPPKTSNEFHFVCMLRALDTCHNL